MNSILSRVLKRITSASTTPSASIPTTFNGSPKPTTSTSVSLTPIEVHLRERFESLMVYNNRSIKRSGDEYSSRNTRDYWIIFRAGARAVLHGERKR